MVIAELRLRSADPAALAAFYAQAFDAEAIVGGCRIGAERIAIGRADDPRPDLFASNETGFQHFAIVVADMARAYARLSDVTGWRPISLAGPELLPASSDGATAFKFRDPDGHPLELLQFAPDAVPPVWRDAGPRVFLGIDHTGISVCDVEASIRYWGSLGFSVAHRQVNSGLEQARLDGFADATSAEVEIVSLSPPAGVRPGVELLGYRSPVPIERIAADASTAATSVVVSKRPLAGRDPNGHRVEFKGG